jgi:hypothetical protein
MSVDDSVVVDAKRILLRYGVPIATLDDIGEPDRIKFARAVSRTPVPQRGKRLTELLVENGYLDASALEKHLKGKKRQKKVRN